MELLTDEKIKAHLLGEFEDFWQKEEERFPFDFTEREKKIAYTLSKFAHLKGAMAVINLYEKHK